MANGDAGSFFHLRVQPKVSTPYIIINKTTLSLGIFRGSSYLCSAEKKHR